MEEWRNIPIREKQKSILICLYRFRGATNDQLRRYLYGHLSSKARGQLANVSRFVSDLKQKGLIKSVSCNPISDQKLNFLTSKGIEYVLDVSFITEEVNGITGFYDDGLLGNFSYDVLKPPLRYLEHHLKFVDTVVDNKGFHYRNNLYSLKEYTVVIQQGEHRYKKNAKIKPDGELRGKNGAILALEIDTGTEGFNKLVNKFRNYKNFFDYCIQNNLEIPWVGIVFQTKRGTQKMDITHDQRWQTILKAASEGLSYYCWSIPVVGFNRTDFISLLNDSPEELKELGIPIPPKENPLLKRNVKSSKKITRGEELKFKQKEVEEHENIEKRKREELKKKELEEFHRKRLANEREAEMKRKENLQNKKGIFSWFSKP